MKNYWNFYLSCTQQQLYGPVTYRHFQETGPSPANRAGSLHSTGPYSLHCFFFLVEFNRVLDNGIIIKNLRCHSNVSVSSSLIKTTGKQTSYLFFSVRLCPQDANRPFSASDSPGTKPLCWRARDTLAEDKQKVWNGLKTERETGERRSRLTRPTGV